MAAPERPTTTKQPAIIDPSKQLFQMRAQEKKADICRKLWGERWSWLLEEKIKAQAETDAIRNAAAAGLTSVVHKPPTTKSLKPVPLTTQGLIGWLGSRQDCLLDIYPSWLETPPIRLPDAWDDKEYYGPKSF